MRNQFFGRTRPWLRTLLRGVSAFDSVSPLREPSRQLPRIPLPPLGHPGPVRAKGTLPEEKGRLLQSQCSSPDGASRTPSLCRADSARSPPAERLRSGKHSTREAPSDVCATDGRRHKGLNPTEGGEHLMRAGSRSPACLRLRGQQSPALAGLRQGAPAPTAIALGAYLASGGDTVLVLVCELVYLVGQLLHGACPEAAAKAPHTLEVVHTLAVALDSDAGSVRTAGLGAARGALHVLGLNESLDRPGHHVCDPGGVAAGHPKFPLPTT